MKRTLLLSSAWTASAAAAVGLGFLAISLVDASASDSGPVTPAAATSGTSVATSTVAPAKGTDGQQVTDGGTVYASCADGSPVLASAPAAGWWLDDSGDAGKVEFENGVLEVEISVSCTAGSPSFVVEGPQPDDSSGTSSSAATSSSSSSSASSTASSSTDDSDGRVGGGHGSDDGSGNDSSGRDGGGHGSDD